MALPAFVEKIREPFEEIQEKLRQQWMTLNPRERFILSSLAGVMGLLLSVLVIKESLTFFYHHTHVVENNLTNYRKIQRLVGELSAQRGQMMRYEKLRQKRGDDFQLTAFLQSEASNFGVVVAKITPTKPKSAKTDEEDWVELQLGPETRLDGALRYLESVDETLGLRIVELELKPNFQEPSKLAVTATIASKKSL